MPSSSLIANSVTQIVGLFIVDEVYALTNVQEAVDYFDTTDDMAVAKLSASEDEIEDYKDSTMAKLKEQRKQTVPIESKVALIVREAAEYSNIGINKIESLLRTPRCPFILYVGKKKLVKRKEFEKFIGDNIEILKHLDISGFCALEK